MAIQIGLIIKQVAESRGLTQEALGKLINLHGKTIADIYRRVTCDTGLLLTLSDKLEHDFFQYYYQEDPLNRMRKDELKELQSQVETLKITLDQREVYIKKIEETVSDKANIIELLKDKVKFLEASGSLHFDGSVKADGQKTKSVKRKK